MCFCLMYIASLLLMLTAVKNHVLNKFSDQVAQYVLSVKGFHVTEAGRYYCTKFNLA